MFSRAALVLTAAVAAGVLLAAPGAGQTTSGPPAASSTVTLNVSRAPTFRGRVVSPDAVCEAKRKITLQTIGTDGRFFNFDSGFTNANGKWQLSQQLDGATTFRARVKAATKGGVACEADLSAVKRVPSY